MLVRASSIACALSLSAWGCNAIFGLSEGHLPAGTGTGGGGAAGQGGTGGLTSAGGGATPSGGAGGVAGAGGSGGALVLPCASCTSPFKCTVVDELTGQWGCGPEGPRPAWSYCVSDGQCAAGLWCDHTSRTCKPICEDAGDCQAGAQCIPALSAQGAPIPSLLVCTSHCHPKDVDPCHQVGGATTCLYRVDYLEFDCWDSGNRAVATPCTESWECAAGLLCVSGQCWRWCDNMVFPYACFTGQGAELGMCQSLNPQVFYEGQQFGACLPPV